jgi:hypothetical protein
LTVGELSAQPLSGGKFSDKRLELGREGEQSTVFPRYEFLLLGSADHS